jgi:hypothetical protein
MLLIGYDYTVPSWFNRFLAKEVNHMRAYRNSMILLLLITFSTALLLPAGAMAASPEQAPAPTVTSGSHSSFSIENLLLGLLLGKILGNNTGNLTQQNGPDIMKSLVNAFLHRNAAAGNETPKEAAIIATAKKYLGVPYVFGGETTSGIDCSSFTQHVMRANGIDLPRTAAEQFAIGTPVNRSDLQPGDLVFFTTYKPGASHVGIYMGNNRFIQASSRAGKVTISNLTDAFYTEHYIGARRYTK